MGVILGCGFSMEIVIGGIDAGYGEWVGIELLDGFKGWGYGY